jgi:hypothetical protein
MNGSIDEVRLYDRALSGAEVAGDYDAAASGLQFAQVMPQLTPGTSVTYQTDAVVRTDASGYQLSIQDPIPLTNTIDHTTTIPSIPATIASPAAWNEGVTKGFGFTVIAGTDLESSWGTGPYNYAAVPSTDTVFHQRGSNATYPPPDGTPEVTSLQFRADTATSQRSGPYQASIIYTATLVP